MCPRAPGTVQDNTVPWLGAFGELGFLALHPTFAIHLMEYRIFDFFFTVVLIYHPIIVVI